MTRSAAHCTPARGFSSSLLGFAPPKEGVQQQKHREAASEAGSSSGSFDISSRIHV